MEKTCATKTISTVCGKTISYFQEPGKNAKMHSVVGPALVHAKDDKKAPEYYIFGIKYSKSVWDQLVNQYKEVTLEELTKLEY